MLDVIASSGTIINPEVTSSIHSMILSILDAAVLAITGGIAWLVKLGISRLKFDWQKSMATRVVSYAEMKIVGGEDKRKYAAAKIHEKFPRLTEEEISHLLEEAVLNLQGLETPTTVVVEAPEPAKPQ